MKNRTSRLFSILSAVMALVGGAGSLCAQQLTTLVFKETRIRFDGNGASSGCANIFSSNSRAAEPSSRIIDPNSPREAQCNNARIAASFFQMTKDLPVDGLLGNPASGGRFHLATPREVQSGAVFSSDRAPSGSEVSVRVWFDAEGCQSGSATSAPGGNVPVQARCELESLVSLKEGEWALRRIAHGKVTAPDWMTTGRSLTDLKITVEDVYRPFSAENALESFFTITSDGVSKAIPAGTRANVKAGDKLRAQCGELVALLDFLTLVGERLYLNAQMGPVLSVGMQCKELLKKRGDGGGEASGSPSDFEAGDEPQAQPAVEALLDIELRSGAIGIVAQTTLPIRLRTPNATVTCGADCGFDVGYPAAGDATIVMPKSGGVMVASQGSAARPVAPGATARVTRDGVEVSGPQTPPPTSSCATNLERDTNRPGSDYRTLQTDTPEACCAVCQSESQCRAFAWEASRTCWLKNAVTAATQWAGFISGVKGGTAPPSQTSCDISGVWRNRIEGFGEGSWTFTAIGANRYSANESGFGSGTGTAVVNGAYVRLDLTYSGGSGYYEWTLNPGCTSGDGITRNSAGTTAKSHIERAGAAPSSLQSNYIGCFRDGGPDRDINKIIWNTGDMTVDRCVAHCREQGYGFAGLQYASTCFCGDSYGKFGPADNCNMKCAGNPNQICGGEWANSVYRVLPSTPPPSSGEYACTLDGAPIVDPNHLDQPNQVPNVYFGQTYGWSQERRLKDFVSVTSRITNDRQQPYQYADLRMTFQEPPRRLTPGMTFDAKISVSATLTKTDMGPAVLYGWYEATGLLVQMTNKGPCTDMSKPPQAGGRIGEVVVPACEATYRFTFPAGSKPNALDIFERAVGGGGYPVLTQYHYSCGVGK